ncbi:Major facilitator superfamily domain, general substrate transporter [Niveomyces insectorum RCEF 264]|uniref:Major facilitator superfamily domain, general substrate transporter n=1 Tax=Niveomyces insectorum RCEF 264 TaxID=1081102 RepID=A0A167N309_9HYPO|nr:Major facilitator superfamily domain, general substrate transporter [Niveomyces insectorum RCEF 264]
MGFWKYVVSFPRDVRDDLRMNKTQALIFFTSWFCWTIGSMHYFLLSYTMPALAKELNVEQSKIAQANTTTMIVRALGSVIFGVVSDQFGRRIPMLVNIALMGIFTLCTGFIKTYGQLVGVRLLYGVAYGGLYGTTMATLLEAVPRRSRGTVAGFTQQGFSAGFILASGFNLATNKYGWRPIYYLGGGLTVVAFVLRLITPTYSVASEAIREAEGIDVVDDRAQVGGNIPFLTKFRYAFRKHWPIFVYCTVLSSCLNTLGHGQMDVYPSFLQTQKGLDVRHETWITVIMQSGGIIGGVLGGYFSKYSPKWVPTIAALFMAPWLPLWTRPNDWRLLAVGAFFLEIGYGAAIGTLGNILQMVCPHPGIRGAFGGVTYNLGNAVSSVAPTIETKLGERWPTANGKPDYGRIQRDTLLIGFLVITLVCMPTKNVNLEWDLEDPNQIIPSILPTTKKANGSIHEEEPSNTIDEKPENESKAVGSNHVETIG